MASSLNKATILGNVGRDPEARRTKNDNAIVNFTIATSERWKDKSTGEPVEKTEWHRVSVMGPLAEVAEKYLKKGDKVYIEGRIETRKWEKDGVEKYSTEIIVSGFGGTLILLGPKGGMGDKRVTARAGSPSSADDDPFSDEIPF